MKVFLEGMPELDNFSITELLEKSMHAKNLLHAYRYMHIMYVQCTVCANI